MRDETWNKVEAVINERHYVPNSLASGLKWDKSKTLGVIVSNIRNQYFSAVVRGIQDYTSSYGYDVFICNTDDNPEREAHYLKTLLSRRVEGLIVTTCAKDKSVYQRLVADGFPLVLLDRPISGLRCDSVGVDNRAVCQQVVERLIALGHQYIGVVTPPCADIGPRLDRVEGCRDGMRRHGFDLLPELVVEIGFGAESIAEATTRLLARQPRPTALFLLNILLAGGIVRELRRSSSLSDFALVTYDDPDWCEFLSPPVSAVRQPTYEIGRIVGRLAIDRISEPQRPIERITLDAEFVERNLPARRAI